MTTLGRKCCYSFHLTDEESDEGGVNDMFKVSRLAVGKVGTQIQAVWF